MFEFISMKKLFLSLLLSASVLVKAQSPWDLQQCINYAIKHNLGLKQQALNNEVNKNNSNQVRSSVLPSLNAGATHQYNFGQTIDRFTNTFANTQVLSQNFYISSSVVLWSGLSQYNNIKANDYSYLSGVERLRQQENDLSLSVANAYIGIIFSEELLKISRNQYQVTKEQLDRTLKLVNAGALAKSVEYDIKAQLANEELNVTTADNNYRLSMLNLQQLMNFDSVTNFSVVRPDFTLSESQLVENNVTAIYETALKNQPGVKSSEYAVMSADKTRIASMGRYSPTLTFNASMGTGTSGLAKKQTGEYYTVPQTLVTSMGTFTYDTQVPVLVSMPFSEQFKNNANKSIGFSLNVPLFNGLQSNTAVKNSKINVLNSQYSAEMTKQTLYKNIVQAITNANAALNKYNASKLSAEAAAESFKYAQQKFDVGAISSFDFTSAKNRLFAAESNLLQAKYDYLFKLKVLDYYQGKPLGF